MNETCPNPTADMNVPRNAKVRMEPKLRKKLSYKEWISGTEIDGGQDADLFKLITRVQDDGR